MKFKKKDRPFEAVAGPIAVETGLTQYITEYLMEKGFDTVEKINKFLTFREEDIRSVRTFKDAPQFIERVVKAIQNNEKITIIGDYDGDGINGTAIALWVFKYLNYPVNYIISNRFNEGYGLTPKLMERLIAQFPDTQLIITLDNGISAFAGVDVALSKGIDVVVSDHHLPHSSGQLPNCICVDEARLDEPQELIDHICGAETIRRLLVEVVKDLGRYDELKVELDKLYAFSGFASITDMMPLNNLTNRYIVKRGLELIKLEQFPCFRALREVCGIKEFNETVIGFKYGPMINAVGRIVGDVTLAVNLLMSETLEEARYYADELFEINAQRQEVSFDAENFSVQEIKNANSENFNFIIVKGDDTFHYPEGIAGLVATSVVKNFGCPAICLGPTHDDANIYKGSGRSIQNFHLKEALDKCADLLIGYGGHAGACGLSVKRENIPLLQERLNQIAEGCKDRVNDVNIDFMIELDGYSEKFAREYKEVLQPFGQCFEEPVYATYGVIAKDNKNELFTVMKEKHVKFLLKNRGKELPIIWFSGINKFKDLAFKENDKLMIVGIPNNNYFNGRCTTQLLLREVEKF